MLIHPVHVPVILFMLLYLIHVGVLDNYSMYVCLLQLIFYAWFKFYFTLFSDMITSDNEFETKENLNQGLY